MLGWLFKLLGGLLGSLFKGGPAIEDIAASAATARAELAQERAANEVLTQAAGARADAADRVVRIVADAPDRSDPAINAELKRQFPDDFR